MFFRKNRRQIERYPVLWESVLEVRYPDYETRIEVTVTNFSGKGALVHSDRMFVNDRLLISAHHRPRLTLKAFSPGGMFQAEVTIRWYCWNVEDNRFDIGLEYADPTPENQLTATRILHFLHKTHREEPGSHQRLQQCPSRLSALQNATDRSPA